MDQTTWLTKNCPSLKGKTAAITGATGGLGREICRGVLLLGGDLLLLNRNADKTEKMIGRLQEEFPDSQISFYPLDLADPESVRRATVYLREHVPDILLHNAGIYDVPRYFCTTGIQNVFQVNFASPYYMTRQLLPYLRERGSRVTVVGSIAHTYAPSDPQDPDFHTRKPCHLAYGNSKRYLMFAFSEFFKGETRVKFSIGHPGITLTNISNHYPSWLFPIIRPFLKLFFMKPQKACRGILYAMCHSMEPFAWSGPRYFGIWGDPSVKKITTCDEKERTEIFKTAETVYQKML